MISYQHKPRKGNPVEKRYLYKMLFLFSVMYLIIISSRQLRDTSAINFYN